MRLRPSWEAAKKVTRVQRAVAEEFKQGAVELIGPAAVGATVVGLEAELLNGVRIREDVGDFGERVFIRPAI